MASLAASDGLLVQLGNQKKLFLSNEILLQEATAPLLLLETVRERGVDSPFWRRRVEKEQIELFESYGGVAAASETREYSLVAKLEVKCHLLEVHNALAADATDVHEAMLRGLHGRRFRRGAVLHCFDDTTGSDAAASGGVVAVKSATFSSGKLGKDVDFNYIDYRRRLPERKAVVHVSKSLPKEFHDRLAKTSVLGGAKEILACTFAEQVSATKTRLFFFASCTVDDEAFSSPEARKGSSGLAALERPTVFLTKLARALTNLESIVVRRRLGFQSFIYLSNKVAARGVKSCKVCEKSFSVLRLEHFCQLCGYRTCNACSDTMEIEIAPGSLRSNRICKTCLDAVNHCVFDDDDLDLLGSNPIADFAVTAGPSFAQMQAELPSTTRRVVVHKKRPNSQPDDEVLKLIEYLFSSDASKQAVALERFGVTSSERSLHPTFRILEGIFRHYLAQPTRLTVAECLYAEADNSREYLLNFEEGLRIADAPPISQEHVRIDLIARLGLLNEQKFISEPFNAICEIAARVMECRTAFVSVVGPDLQYAIAHFNLSLQKLPRRETLCAYALTSDRPFIVRNTLHDMRFRDFFCVARGGFQFYASFPVDAPSSVGGGGIVAALVTVDREPKRVITNRQYARMIVLTRVLTELLGALPAN